MTAARVFAADTGDGVALMDLGTTRGKWRFLDPVGAGLWRKVVSGTPREQAVEELVTYWAQRGIDPDRVRADMNALAGQLDAEGLFTAAPHPPTSRAPEVRYVDTVAQSRPVVRAAGHVGLGTALVLLRCLPVRLVVRAARLAGRLPGRAASQEEADAVCAAVRRAVGWWPGRAACLEESLAAYLAAAMTGRRVAWVLGARFVPQGAHAWIATADAVHGQEPADRVWPYRAALTVESSN
ncbi:lasso peptide biosynthesis B2 protein [Streptomyces sp. CB02115]|uniref:lasso peptide biosynthesis B2 protein n=1 Tax=Streptomyces sp. CB02115 TaxID=1703939 RepID=UPI0009A1F9C9|nr:lasso peptide biosynthesis B2 protein [Streptomyces sp. CB02115]